MTNRDEDYTLSGDIVRETEKAWLFRNDVDNEEYWLPKSRCEWDEIFHRMRVPGWLIEEKDIPV